MNITSILPPPDGVTSNFDNPDTMVSQTYAIVISTLTLACVAAALRVYTKTFILSSGYGADDLFLGFAMILSICQDSLVFRATKFGLGYHAWDIPITQYKDYKTSFLIAINFHVSSVAMSKVSMILFFLRFMPKRPERMVAYANVAAVLIYNTGIILSFFLGCKPIKVAWDPTVEGGVCIDQTPIYIALIALNVATDLYLLLVPIPMLIKLRLPVSQKISLGVVFAAGGAIIIITIIWLVKCLRMNTPREAADFTYYVADITNWAVIETNLSIVVASIPALKPLLVRIFPNATQNSGSYDSPRNGTGPSSGSRILSHPLKSFTRSRNREAFEGDDTNLVTVSTKAMDHASRSVQSNESQENMVPQSGHNLSIMKQTEVRVDFDTASTREYDTLHA